MDLDDYNILIFKHYPINNFYIFLCAQIHKDFLQIKSYYYNFFSWKKWNIDIITFFTLLLFYSLLILFNNLHWFLLFKILFFFVKYLLKYIFILIDFFFHLLFLQLNLKNDLYSIPLKVIYFITFRFFYLIYIFIFHFLPSITQRNFLIHSYRKFKIKSILSIHLFLDFLEWLPYSPLMDLPHQIPIVFKKIKFFLININRSRFIIFSSIKNNLLSFFLYYYLYTKFYFQLFLLNTRYLFFTLKITFFNHFYFIYLLGIFNLIAKIFSYLLIFLNSLSIFLQKIFFKLQEIFYLYGFYFFLSY